MQQQHVKPDIIVAATRMIREQDNGSIMVSYHYKMLIRGQGNGSKKEQVHADDAVGVDGGRAAIRRRLCRALLHPLLYLPAQVPVCVCVGGV